MVVEQNVFKVGLYPIAVGNMIGYQDPTIPGSIKVGNLANSDLDDAFPGKNLIEMVAKDDDSFYIQFDSAPDGITNINVVIDNPEECGNSFTADLVFDGTINYTATISGIYNFLLANEKNIIPIRLEMS
jgi:hypothetical protein